MNIRTLIKIYTVIGAAMVSLGALWWGVVYYFVSQQTGDNMWDSVSCIVSLSERCNFLRGMAWLRGINPYEPLFVWLGLTVLLMALSFGYVCKRGQKGNKPAVVGAEHAS